MLLLDFVIAESRSISSQHQRSEKEKIQQLGSYLSLSLQHNELLCLMPSTCNNSERKRRLWFTEAILVLCETHAMEQTICKPTACSKSLVAEDVTKSDPYKYFPISLGMARLKIKQRLAWDLGTWA